MIFIEKPTSPGLPYPEAAPGMGWTARYPSSGPAQQTSPTTSREVLYASTGRGRPRHRPLNVGPLYTAPAPPWTRRQQLYRWLAAYWLNQLTSAQRSAWGTFLTTVNASPNPPVSWRFRTLFTNGFQLYIFYNSCNELLVQLPFQPIDPSLAPPFPGPPGAWTPPTVTSLSATIDVASSTRHIAWTLATPAETWITVYVSVPGRTNSAFIAPQAIRTIFTDLLAGQTSLDGDWYDFGFAIPPAKTLFTVALRSNDIVNKSPSNTLTQFLIST